MGVWVGGKVGGLGVCYIDTVFSDRVQLLLCWNERKLRISCGAGVCKKLLKFKDTNPT